MNYRPDIDGIRAFAVLSVIIFHVNHDILPGGFIGVDVFFVISSFLITSIISKEIKKSSFSFLEFYTRRIKRILPVMYLMLLTTLITGYILLLPKDFYLLAKSTAFSIISLSNIYFSKSTDYFGPNSDSSPLIHTWSLSIEEQFYIIFPFFIYVLLRKKTDVRKPSIIIIIFALISILYSFFFSNKQDNTSSVYYSLIARSGEFLIGSILAINYKIITDNLVKINSTLIQLLITGLIIYSLWFISTDSSYPSINYLVPVLMTVLIISSGNYGKQTFYTKILSTPIFVYIGKISYSLYLWHWPVFSYIRYIYIDNNIPIFIWIYALLFTWLISHISWKAIEIPYREKKYKFKQALFLIIMPPTIIIISLIIYIYTTVGIPSRFGQDHAMLFNITAGNTCHGNGQDHCFDGDHNHDKYKVALFGDSHAGHYSELLRLIGLKHNFSIEINTNNNCQVLIGMQSNSSNDDILNQRCTKLINKLSTIKNQYDIVILALRWEDGLFSNSIEKNNEDENFYNALTKTIDYLKENNITVILLGQIPKYKFDINRYELISKKIGINKEVNIDFLYENANSKLKEISIKKNVYFLDIGKFFCHEGKCRYKDNNKLLYKDDDHMNQFGAKFLMEQMSNSAEYQLLIDLIKKNYNEK